MNNVFIYLFISLIGGLIAGMGMGGGTLLIPLFTIFTDMGQLEAQGYNLAAFIPMAIVTLFIHKKNGYLKWMGLLPLIISSAVFSVIGGFVASVTSATILKKCFGVFLLALAVWQTFSLFESKKSKGAKQIRQKPMR